MSITGTIQNRAAWLDEPNTALRVGDAELPTPESNEVLIKVHAVAINPVEAGRQAMGLFNVSYPWIFGCDLAGTVEGVGADVTRFKVGDRVTALSREFNTHKTSDAAYQNYMKTTATNVCKIPSSTSFTDAAVFPLALSTAAGMCFESVTLTLRYPMDLSILQRKEAGDEVVTVWGGSSSVGCCAIQMVRAAGYHVVALGSPRNNELMRNCGADECFDYSDPNLVESVVAFVKRQGWTSSGILAAAGMLPFGPVADETTRKCGELALRLGGNMFVSTCLARGAMEVPKMPEGVKASNVSAISEEKVREHIWDKWMEGALETGLLKPLPPADVVAEGLDGINVAIELMKKGVSGKKLVVKIC